MPTRFPARSAATAKGIASRLAASTICGSCAALPVIEAAMARSPRSVNRQAVKERLSSEGHTAYEGPKDKCLRSNRRRGWIPHGRGVDECGGNRAGNDQPSYHRRFQWRADRALRPDGGGERADVG